MSMPPSQGKLRWPDPSPSKVQRTRQPLDLQVGEGGGSDEITEAPKTLTTTTNHWERKF